MDLTLESREAANGYRPCAMNVWDALHSLEVLTINVVFSEFLDDIITTDYTPTEKPPYQ